MSFWLKCHQCGKMVEFGLKKSRCTCGGTLLVEYDLGLASQSMTKDTITNRSSNMWRYFELLPIKDPQNIVTLGEGWTPLIRLKQAEKKLPLRKLWVKREEQNPTGSFKSRGFSAAISIAKEYGIQKVVVNSNGNAGSALAAYAGYAGMEAYVFLPKDCPGPIVEECRIYGAQTVLVDGLIHDAGKIIQDGESDQGWYNVGTLKEPGRAEGKKTMGFELAEQLNWKLPNIVIYPTGGGSGIIGMWKAFNELKSMGLIEGELPRFVSVQEQGCDPLVRAMETKASFKPQNEEVNSTPTGMRVPNPPDGNLLVSILTKTGGTAVAVSKEEIRNAQLEMGKNGISSSPEGAATWAGLLRLIETGFIRPEDEVVLFNTSHALKYLPWLPGDFPVVKTYKDWLTRQNALKGGDVNK